MATLVADTGMLIIVDHRIESFTNEAIETDPNADDVLLTSQPRKHTNAWMLMLLAGLDPARTRLTIIAPRQAIASARQSAVAEFAGATQEIARNFYLLL